MQIVPSSSFFGSVILSQSKLFEKSHVRVPSRLCSLTWGYDSSTRMLPSGSPTSLAASVASFVRSLLQMRTFPGPSFSCLTRSFAIDADDAALYTPPAAMTP